jgi:hypothetical protein
MLFTVVVLYPTTTFTNTYSTLQSATAYARRVMSASDDAIEVLILRTNNGTSKVAKRYHRGNV